MEVLHSETNKIYETKLRGIYLMISFKPQTSLILETFYFLGLIKSDSLVLSHYHQNIFSQGYPS